jgi:hypothetical protein
MKRLSTLCACLLACGPAPAQMPPMGRLFSTPAEREQLDARRAGLPAPSVAFAAPLAAPAPPPPIPVTVDGIVRRSSGKTTVWLNREAQDAPPGSLAGSAAAPAYRIVLPSGASVAVKPGQKVDLSAGTVNDVDAAH